jgi:cell fate (sporulation/competence/biofilm development) regulator YlbF (YheA/YmcA/DUF963 family)
MDKVFEKTRELGAALLECEVYQNMKAAEDKAMANSEAASEWRISSKSAASCRQ